MNVPFGCTQSDFTGACTRFNTLIQRICEQIVTDDGVVYSDIYANRVNYPAAKYPKSIFVATDQNVAYQSQMISGASQWAYVAGIIYGTTSGSGNLISSDAGVLLLTSTTPVKLYRWSGSAWQDVTPSSGAGISTSGPFTLIDTHANRLAHCPASKYPAGTQFFESNSTFSDRQVTYVVQKISGTNVWVYQSGVFTSSYANMPTDLSSSDAGFRFSDQTYMHEWLWSGTAWGNAPGDPGSQFIVMAAAAPPGGVWYPCDGAAHTCTTATGGTTSVTPPNYNGTVAAIFGGGYGETVNPATSPTLEVPASASTISESGADVAVSTGTGNQVTLKTHTHNVTVSQALINPPTVANGGLPAYFTCSFWLRA